MTELQTTIEETLALEDLRPNEKTNQTLRRLVALVTAPDATLDGVTPEVMRQVQQVAAKSEGYMEAAWSDRIAAAQNPEEEATSFWYRENYAQLTRHEMALLQGTGLHPDEVQRGVIIGSGPLPMTALHMQEHMPGADFLHIDNNPEAVRQGERFLRALGKSGVYACADGAHAPLTGEYDIALVAALAGETVEEKQKIMHNVTRHLSSDGRVLVRGAHGARGLLYPVFPAAALSGDGVSLLATHHPQDDTINSIFIYGKEQT